MFYRLPAEFDLASCFWLICLLLPPPTIWRLSGLCWSYEDGGLLFSSEEFTPCSFIALPLVLPDCCMPNRACSPGCILSYFRLRKLEFSAAFEGLEAVRESPSNAEISWLLLERGRIGSMAVALAEF